MSGTPADDLMIRCVIELNAEGEQVMVTRSDAVSREDVQDLCKLVLANDPVVRWLIQ